MNYCGKYFWWFLLCLVISFSAHAQRDISLPKLLPSYSEDFIDYKSNPSMCFDNAFFDGSGRMWLTPCTGTLTGLHLFQFDGYEFKAVRGTLDKLPTDTKFVLMDEKQRLVGYVNEQGNRQVVVYSPQTDELVSYPFPPSEVNEIFRLSYDQNDVLKVLALSDNHLLQYELKDEQLVLIHKIEMEFQNSRYLINIIGEKEIGIWYWSQNFDKLYQLDIETGKRKAFTLSGVNFSTQDIENTPPFVGKLYPIGDACYFSLHIIGEQRTILLKQETESGRFNTVKGLPLNARDIQVFSDESGNVVFLSRYFNNEYKALLEDQEGRQYDYSAFFPPARVQGTNTFLKSPDFKQQLLVCHSQGILLQTVKVSGAITQILSKNSIRAMVELPGQKTLITTQQPFKSFIYENRTGQIETWENPACDLGWTKLLKDKDGFIWGVGNQVFTKYDPINNACEKYPTSVFIRNVIALAGDYGIAFIREDQLAFFDLKDKEISTFKGNGAPLRIPGFVHDMLYSGTGLLWIATTKGMIKVDVESKTYEVIGLNEPFLDFRFLCIHEDERGWLWLGTLLGGIHIYNPETGELKILNNEGGLANNTVVSILADDDGDIWAGTYNGISIISPDGQLVANLYEDDGLVDRESNRYAYLKTSDGKLLIGTVNGLSVIEPRKVKQRLAGKKNMKIYLTAVSYFDAHKGRFVSKRYGLDNIGTLTLPADRRNLNVKFAVSNYIKPEYNQYDYRLEGISHEWISIGNQNSLNLSNMPSGHYRLLIRGSDGTGNWTPEPLAIFIHAREYFYKQTWFYLLCFALIGGLAFLWIQRLQSAVRKATKTILEDKEIIEQQAEKLLELDHAKSRFFTNISHEFRTPLTIISGMAGQILNNPQAWAQKGGQMIKQNSSNLLNLVNQILDLRKLEANELKLNLVQGDVVQYLRYLARSYEPYAQSMGLQLHYLPAVEKLVMDYDPEKMLRIISNLLTNAVKYTPDKGNVYLHVSQSNENDRPTLQLRVEDTGTGIPADQLPYIFDRFYQVDDSNTRKGEGTGIGLALTKELVKLMNGSIDVKSILGIGSTFTVSIPITNESQVREAFYETVGQVDGQPDGSLDVHHIEDNHQQVAELQTDKLKAEDLPTLLIVEDNPDIRQFLVACLENNYQLETATNGQEGIDLALEIVPDLIISDVMMPEKDGFELCEMLKNDERTSHVPVILLTAKTDMESKISGLKTGADAYLTKPFEQEELMVRLEKLFELRQKLQARYRSLEPETAPENKEDEFVQKVRQAVLANISDETFGIAQLCRAVGLSRAQLHNKLKALTGQSTSHFIRSIRLHKAKELLESSDLNISEVGYEVGFKNPSHFSSAYQEVFGVPPSKTRK